jgi:hypothetical protein
MTDRHRPQPPPVRRKRRPSTAAPARARDKSPPAPPAPPPPGQPDDPKRRRDLAARLAFLSGAVERTADPAALVKAAADVIEAGHAIEGLGLELALRVCQGIEMRAATLAGVKHGALRRTIGARGRHATLGTLAVELRQAAGYAGRGNPNLPRPPRDEQRAASPAAPARRPRKK